MNSSKSLPNELIDHIIDYLRDYPVALYRCNLVASSWRPAARFHMFNQRHLIRAAQEGIAEIILFLITLPHIDVNAESIGHWPKLSHYASLTPLCWAVWGGHEEAVSALLSCEAVIPDKRASSGGTALSIASRSGHAGIVALLLARDDVDPGSTDRFNRSPLIYAIERGRIDVLKLLLARDDADPDGNYPHNILLTLAASHGHEQIVSYLLLLGTVDVDSRGLDGVTPLISAVIADRKDVIRLLLAKGADVNAKCLHGNPLSLAAKWGHGEVMALLLAHGGVNAGWKEAHGRSWLMRAAKAGHISVVATLLAENCVDGASEALLLAKENRRTKVVALLKERCKLRKAAGASSRFRDIFRRRS